MFHAIYIKVQVTLNPAVTFEFPIQRQQKLQDHRSFGVLIKK